MRPRPGPPRPDGGPETEALTVAGHGGFGHGRVSLPQTNIFRVSWDPDERVVEEAQPFKHLRVELERGATVQLEVQLEVPDNLARQGHANFRDELAIWTEGRETRVPLFATREKGAQTAAGGAEGEAYWPVEESVARGVTFFLGAVKEVFPHRAAGGPAAAGNGGEAAAPLDNAQVLRDFRAKITRQEPAGPPEPSGSPGHDRPLGRDIKNLQRRGQRQVYQFKGGYYDRFGRILKTLPGGQENVVRLPSVPGPQSKEELGALIAECQAALLGDEDFDPDEDPYCQEQDTFLERVVTELPSKAQRMIGELPHRPAIPYYAVDMPADPRAEATEALHATLDQLHLEEANGKLKRKEIHVAPGEPIARLLEAPPVIKAARGRTRGGSDARPASTYSRASESSYGSIMTTVPAPGAPSAGSPRRGTAQKVAGAEVKAFKADKHQMQDAWDAIDGV